jgi:hypothetical protein
MVLDRITTPRDQTVSPEQPILAAIDCIAAQGELCSP